MKQQWDFFLFENGQTVYLRFICQSMIVRVLYHCVEQKLIVDTAVADCHSLKLQLHRYQKSVKHITVIRSIFMITVPNLIVSADFNALKGKVTLH